MAETPDTKPQPKTLLVALDWVEAHCVVPDGFRRGEPLRLYDYQFKFLANHYLVRGDAEWLPHSPMLGPAFVHRRSLLVGPQKLGKGPNSALQCCLEGAGPALFAGWAGEDDGYVCADNGCGCGWEYPYEPGEPMGMLWPTPLIQVTAVSQEQVDNVYGALRPMIDLGPLSDVIPRTGEEFIRLPGGGRIDAVTSSAQSRLGQRVTFCPQDEVGLWTPQNKMVKVADTQFRGLAGMGGRAVLTTNAWDPSDNSVAQQQFESSASDIYRQFVQPPAHLSYRNKQERRKIHRLVYGETLKDRGGHIDLDSVEAEAADLLERDPAQAERFFGNRIVYGTGTYLPSEVLWEDAESPRRVVAAGEAVAAGFDGSDSDDWSGIRLETHDGHRFTPTYGPYKRLTVWNPVEWGGKIPRREVHVAWEEITSRYNLVRAYCDPRDWQSEIGDWALLYGERVFVEWATNRVTATHAALERNLVDLRDRSSHDGCKVTKQHYLNARRVAYTQQRYLLEKASQTQKIDLCMSDVLAHEAWADATADGTFQKAMKPKSSRVVVIR